MVMFSRKPRAPAEHSPAAQPASSVLAKSLPAGPWFSNPRPRTGLAASQEHLHEESYPHAAPCASFDFSRISITPPQPHGSTAREAGTMQRRSLPSLPSLALSPGVGPDFLARGGAGVTAPPRSVGAGGGAARPEPVPSPVSAVLQSPGEPLDPRTRFEMERRLGQDLGAVRIHTDARAAESARSVDALAYTVGSHIVFGAGLHAPETLAGTRLLGHELAHVLQQREGLSRSTAAPSQMRIGQPGDSSEREADRISAFVERSGPARPASPQAAPPRLPGHLPVPDAAPAQAPWLHAGSAPVLSRQRAPRAAAAVTVRRIELYLAESRLVVVVEDGSPLVFNVISPPTVPPGTEYRWGLRDGVHRLSVGTQSDVLVRFQGAQRDLAAFQQALRGGAEVPVHVYAAAGAPIAGRAPAAAGGSATGTPAAPLEGDEGALAGNPALAGLYLDFLRRYAGVQGRPDLTRGLSAEQVRALVEGNPRAGTMTRYFTQGFREFEATGSSSLSDFSVLEEALLDQWSRGNYNVLHNRLQISADESGLGLFFRGTPIKCYDAAGLPIPGAGGGYRDPAYRAVAPPSFAIRVQVPDGLRQVLEAVRQTVGDQTVEVYLAARGYVDNGDLLWPAVRAGWDGWRDIEAELQRQMPILVGFLGGHLVALVMQRSGNPTATAIGTLISGLLHAAGRVFQIAFAGTLLVLAYRCGRELSLIRRQPGEPLDSLSQRHLAQAAVAMRELLTAMLAAGLTAAMLATARASAITLSDSLPPPGGTGPRPVPAGVGAARPGAAAAAGPPGELPLPLAPAPVLMSGGEERGGRGGQPGGRGRAPTPERTTERATPRSPPPAERNAASLRQTYAEDMSPSTAVPAEGEAQRLTDLRARAQQALQGLEAAEAELAQLRQRAMRDPDAAFEAASAEGRYNERYQAAEDRLLELRGERSFLQRFTTVYERALYRGRTEAEIAEMQRLMRGWNPGANYTSVEHSVYRHAERHGFSAEERGPTRYLDYLREAARFDRAQARREPISSEGGVGTTRYSLGNELLITDSYGKIVLYESR
ncbi:DUF4157 domain-containing protein [Sorangium sp. So ce185]|uniref:eCIS core domain-containing protein n=1 Tax=Sorangium sp. So ce185 TaxID=3133287 RepID=UPI003F6444FF